MSFDEVNDLRIKIHLEEELRELTKFRFDPDF